jgi:hypothetical protein
MTSSLKGYRVAERHNHYGGVEQRWLIVESQQRKQADIQECVYWFTLWLNVTYVNL